MKLCVAVLDVGSVPYSSVSRSILEHYFTTNNIPYHFITSSIVNGIDLNNKAAHPSWWKMIIHRILPDYDYIICWDLDLLPKSPSVNIINLFDLTNKALTMAFDSPGNTVSFAPHFKYNGGLIGIPSSLSFFTEYIYDTYAPGTLPSYEQYYLNEEIFDKEIAVYELPRNINVLYPTKLEERPQFHEAILQHYTYGFGSQENRLQLIENHKATYFSGDSVILYPTRNHMVKELIKKGGNYAEIGVFTGDFSKYLHSTLEPNHLALFDIFEGYCGSGDVDGNNMKFTYLENDHIQLQDYFKGHNVSIHKGNSNQTLPQIYEDDLFDMIYIDAEHTYESVIRDLELSYKKIKNNGFIMGHDYDVNPKKTEKNYDYTGVRQAVKEFCDKYKQQLFAKALDGCISFCIQIHK